MKLSKTFSQRNLNGMYSIDLEENYEKISTFMQGDLRYSIIVNLTKNRFLQHVQKNEGGRREGFLRKKRGW